MKFITNTFHYNQLIPKNKMEEKIKKTVEQLSAMFESAKDAIQVIDEIILPMRGEIVHSDFWNKVRADLFIKFNAVPGVEGKREQQKDFLQPMGGFQIRVLENALMPEGKGMLMLHPKDYKSYMDKVLRDKKGFVPGPVAKFVRDEKDMVISNGKEYEKVDRVGVSPLPRPYDIVVHDGRSTLELEIPFGYDEKFLIDNEYYAMVNNSGCSLYRPK